MAGPIASLYVALGLDARQFTAGTKQVATEFKSLESSVSRVNPTLGKLFGIAEPGFKSLGKTTVVAGGAITELGQATKVAGGWIQELPAPLSRARLEAASFKQSMVPMAGVMTGAVAAGVALGEAMQKLGEAIGQSIGAAAQEEENIAKLGAALRANVPNWDGDTSAIEQNIKQREQLAFSDDDLRNSMAQLTFVTHDVGKALDAQRVAMDLARGKSLDLNTASVIVGKVLGGNVSILKRYGIAIGDIHDPLQALAALQKTFAGQSEAYAKTLKGQMEAATIAINDANEAFGSHLLPTTGKVVTAINTKVIPAVANLTDNLGTLAALLTRTPTGIDESRLFSWIPQALINTYPGLRDAVDGAKKAITDEFLRKSGPGFNLDHLNIEYHAGPESPLVQAAVKAYYAALAFAAHDIERTGSSPLIVAMKKNYADAQASAAHGIERIGSSPLIQAAKAAYDAAAATAAREIERDPAWANLGKNIPSAITQGLLDDRSVLESGMSQLADILKNGLSPKQLKMEAEGKRAMRLFNKGMKSEKTGAKEQAEANAGAAIAAIEDVANGGYLGGKDAKAVGIYLAGLANDGIKGQKLEAFLAGAGLSQKQIDGIKAQYPDFFAAGAGAGQETIAGWKGQPYYKAGQHASSNIIAGVAAGSWWSAGAAGARNWIGGFKDKFDAFNWANFINSSIGVPGANHKAAGGDVTAGQAYVVGEHHPELFIPKTSGTIMPSLPPMASPRAMSALGAHWQGGITINIGAVYGGPAGLRQLSQDIERAVRQGVRGANYQAAR